MYIFNSSTLYPIGNIMSPIHIRWTSTDTVAEDMGYSHSINVDS